MRSSAVFAPVHGAAWTPDGAACIRRAHAGLKATTAVDTVWPYSPRAIANIPCIPTSDLTNGSRLPPGPPILFLFPINISTPEGVARDGPEQ